MTQPHRGRLHRLGASIAGLPRWVQAWLIVLASTNMASLAYLDSQVGVWTAVAFAAVAAANMPLMLLQGGMTRLLAFPHFLWFPLVAWLLVQLHGKDPLPAGSDVRMYASIVVIVNGISLAFDVVDSIKWLRGGREILGLPRG